MTKNEMFVSDSINVCDNQSDFTNLSKDSNYKQDK